MSDAALKYYKGQEKIRVDAEYDTLLRRSKISELEAERNQVLSDMADSGLVDFTKEFSKSVLMGGVRDGVVTGSTKVADSIGWGFEKVMSPILDAVGQDVFGMSKQQTFEMGRDFGGDVQRATKDVKKGIETKLPEVPLMNAPPEPGEEPSLAYTTETLGRSMVQFYTFYGPVLKAMPIGASALRGDITAGAVADMLAFENKTGTFSDFARELGFDNALTQWLSGLLSDNEFDASLKAGLEGAALGGMFWIVGKTFRALRAGYKQYKPTYDPSKTGVSTPPGFPDETVPLDNPNVPVFEQPDIALDKPKTARLDKPKTARLDKLKDVK